MDTLLVTGAKASHNHTVHTMHAHMNKAKSSLVKMDDVGDVLIEAVSALGSMRPEISGERRSLCYSAAHVLFSGPGSWWCRASCFVDMVVF